MFSYDKKYLTWTFVVLCFGCSLICGEQHDFQFDGGDDGTKVSLLFFYGILQGFLIKLCNRFDFSRLYSLRYLYVMFKNSDK